MRTKDLLSILAHIEGRPHDVEWLVNGWHPQRLSPHKIGRLLSYQTKKIYNENQCKPLRNKEFTLLGINP